MLVFSTSLILQDIDKHAQQHMGDVVERAHCRDGALASHARTHLYGHLFEAEEQTLQNDERFDLRVFEREAAREDFERLAIDADVAGGWVVDFLGEDESEKPTEEENTEAAGARGVPSMYREPMTICAPDFWRVSSSSVM